MGRRPCCSKEGLNRGAWSAREDRILTTYINAHGEGKWRDLPPKAGLRRCGKSCRLRWLNYLRPNIKRGNISVEEEELIIRLHKLLGNRWSIIAGRLPGRTDNEIKNYWNTHLCKKYLQDPKTQKQLNKSKDKKPASSSLVEVPTMKVETPQHVIRTKAVRCTKKYVEPALDGESHSSLNRQMDDCSKFLLDFDIDELFISDVLNSELLQVCGHGVQETDNMTSRDDGGNNTSLRSDFPFSAHDQMLEDSKNEAIFENWRVCDPLQPNATMELNTLSSLLDSEDEWMERQ